MVTLIRQSEIDALAAAHGLPAGSKLSAVLEAVKAAEAEPEAEELGPAHRPTRAATHELPASPLTGYPAAVVVTWSVNHPDADGGRQECVPTSVTVTHQDGRGAPTGRVVEIRRGPGEMALAPAADVDAAADKLATAKTMEDVAVLFTEVMAAGVVPTEPKE